MRRKNLLTILILLAFTQGCVDDSGNATSGVLKNNYTGELESENISFCTKIDSRELKIDCYGRFAGFIEDRRVCDQLSVPEDRVSCLTGYAFARNDRRICESIQKKEGVIKCLTDYALLKNDRRICEVIDSGEGNFYCFTQFAIEKEDRRFCEFVSNENLSKECIIEFSKHVSPNACKVLSKPRQDECWDVVDEYKMRKALETYHI